MTSRFSCLISSRYLLSQAHYSSSKPGNHHFAILSHHFLLSISCSCLFMFLCFLFFPIPPAQMPFGKERGRERNKELASCLFSPWLGSLDPGLPSPVPSSPAHSTPWLCHTSSPMSTCSFHFQGLVLSVCP